jgi:FkbM family methyltransferase
VLNKDSSEKLVQASKNIANLNKKNAEILPELKKIKYYIEHSIERCIFYKPPFDAFERKGVIDAFLEFRNRPDFNQCFLNLMAGLDDESRKTLVRFHRRIELVHGIEDQIDLLTQEEQQEIRRQNQYMGKNTFKLSDDCFCMGEFMLPVNMFNRSIFFDKYGLDNINDIKKLEGKHIIDGGAFIGDSLLILHKLTDKQVHCFEPMSKNYKLLEKTIQLNNIKNVVTNKAALGDECGLLELHSPEGAEKVIVGTLDDYVADKNITVGLIKVDIEGFEQAFLKGAKNTICTQKPTLIISIYHKPEDLYYIKPTIESWNLRYTFKIHKAINAQVLTELTLIAEVNND